MVLDVRLEATELPVVGVLLAIALQECMPWNEHMDSASQAGAEQHDPCRRDDA